jgi:hypothetical protein
MAALLFLPVQAFAGSETTFSVGTKDLSGQRSEVVNAYAARVSNDAIVVLYRGSDKALQDQVRAGASDAKNAGIPVRGMVMADDTEGYGENYVIYVDGLAVTNAIDAREHPYNVAKREITYAQKYLPKK